MFFLSLLDTFLMCDGDNLPQRRSFNRRGRKGLAKDAKKFISATFAIFFASFAVRKLSSST